MVWTRLKKLAPPPQAHSSAGGGGAAQRGRWLLLALAGGLWGGGALAQVEVTTLTFSPTHIGKGQETQVTVGWTHSGVNAGAFTIAVPTYFDVSASGACALDASVLTCSIPSGDLGSLGSLGFKLLAKQIGSSNLSAAATVPSTGTATATYYIRASGAVTVEKEKTLPTDDPIAGQPIEFTLRPKIAAEGESIPAGAVITVTDNLPGTATDFEYTNFTSTGPTPACSPTGRKLVCTYTAPADGWTLTQFNAATITVRGRALVAGSSLKNEAVVNVDPTQGYVDVTNDDNTAVVSLNVLYGGDIQALGVFIATPVISGSTQTLTIHYRNNGPLPSTGNGQVATIIPSGFTIGTLPVGCVGAGAGTIDSVVGTRINCTVTNVLAGKTVPFEIPLEMPALGSGHFPVQVTPPTGFDDYNGTNNLVQLPYQIAAPYADLSLTKSKTGGPQLTGAVITNSFIIKNNAGTTLSYDTNTPLRVVDYLRPEEIASDAVSDVTIGWTCVVTSNADSEDPQRTKRVACQTTGTGTLAVDAIAALSFKTMLGTLSALGIPVALSNRACTGGSALTALGLAEDAGPQPADTNTSNDCKTAHGDGGQLYLTDLETPTAAVKKYVSTDGNDPSNDAQTSTDAPTLANDGYPLKWRIVITTPAGNQNIATLRLTDAIPARIAANTSYWPATDTAITVSGAVTSSCPATLGATGSLVCDFKDVGASSEIVVDVVMKRPIRFTGTGHENKAVLTSPDSVLTATSLGSLTDPAWVKVMPRYDPAVSSKKISKDRPAIGESVNFTITVRNEGAEDLPVGSFTLTDAINTNAELDKAAFQITAAPTGTGFDCAASDLATGAISCVNTEILAKGATKTVTIPVRVKKPTATTLPVNASAYLWAGSDSNLDQENTAVVTLNSGLCEWREKTQISGACGDANSLSNNQQTAKFAVKVPDFDLQVKLDKLHSTVGVRDTLSYKLTMRNAGPSMAEKVSLTTYLQVPPGYALEPVLNDAASGDPILVKDINVGSQTAGFTFKDMAGSEVACTFIEARVTPSAPPAVVCSMTGAGGADLNAKQEVNFTLDFKLTSPAGGATGPVRISVPTVVCAAELDGHESVGKCFAADRATDGFDPTASSVGYGNNYEKVNDIIFPETDLLITKTTLTTSPVTVGQAVKYQLVVGNKGADTPSRIRVVDTLPAGFEWIDTTTVQASVTGATTLAAPISVSPSAPTAGTQNVCWISNGVTVVANPVDQQKITCDLEGSFPPDTEGTANTVVLTLNARPKSSVYAGPYVATDAVNQSLVSPGFEDDGATSVSLDKVPENNTSKSPVQVVKSSIAGFVYHDANNNGVKEGGEAAINGVTVTLTGTDSYDNLVTATTTTAGDGAYKFDNLAPGTYTVTETHPNTWVDGKDTVGVFGATPGSGTASNDVIRSIALPADTHGTEYNFGELKQLTGGQTTATISGHVYHDANNDGVKDAGEASIAGVTITLTGVNGDVRTQVTDSSGFYEFTGLEPGVQYTVAETQPAGWTDGKDTAGTVHTQNSATNDKFVVAPDSGGNGLHWNFGEQKTTTPPPPSDPKGSISCSVFDDLDQNGSRDPGESGIAGVTIRLLNAQNQPVASTVTAADGSYSFANQPVGTYTVVQELPSGYSPTTLVQRQVQVQANQNSAACFGVTTKPQPGSIGCSVFDDANENGTRDADEKGLGGVTIRLFNDKDEEVASTTTAADGSYSFADLAPGTYKVSQVLPSGYSNTTPVERSTTVLPGKNASACFGVLPAKVKPGSVGCSVFDDADKNGQRDPGEGGLSGVTVRLLDADGKLLSTTTSASDGTYGFPDLAPGSYTVETDLPTGYSPTGSTSRKVTVAAGADVSACFGAVGKPSALVVVKTLYEGWNAGAACGTSVAKKELLIVEKIATMHDLTWCFAVTNPGTKHVGAPVWEDSAYPGMVATAKAGTSLPLAPGATGTWYYQAKHNSSVLNVVGVQMPVTDPTGKLIPDEPPAKSSDDGKATFGMIYDPPYGVKVGSVDGADIINWTMVWVNDNIIAANNVYVSDTVKAPMEFVPGSLSCVGEGATSVVPGTCQYAAATKTVSVRGNFAADFGKTVVNASHRLFISFKVKVPKTEGPTSYENQGTASWTPPGSTDPIETVTVFVPGVKVDPIDPKNPTVPVVNPPPGVGDDDPSIGHPGPGNPGTDVETPVVMDPDGPKPPPPPPEPPKPPPPPPVSIPTLSEWGLILLSCLVGLMAVRRLPVARRW